MRVSRRAEDFNLAGRVTPCAPAAVPFPDSAGKGLPALPFPSDFFAMRRVCAGKPAASIPSSGQNESGGRVIAKADDSQFSVGNVAEQWMTIARRLAMTHRHGAKYLCQSPRRFFKGTVDEQITH